MRFGAVLLVTIVAAGAAACASSGSPPPASICASNAPCTAKTSVTSAERGGAAAPTAAGAPAIATVWQSRCGSCHVRVEPGTRDRGTLETALKRHRTRVKMDETQWASLVDFLAAPPPR